MSGEERAANLEKLANARRLRVTAIIPPQYNPINRGWNHPAVPRHFILLHPSSPCSSPFVPTPSAPSRLRPAARFNARFQRSPSFLHLFAGAPRPITSGVPHPRRYASILFFPRVSLSLSLSPPTLLSYSAFISSLGILLLAARAGLIFFLFPPRYFLLTARRCTMRINEEHTSKQRKKKETSFLCCKLERTGLPCFFYDTVFPWCRHLRGWFRAALASWFPNEFSSRRFVDRSRLNASFPRNISLRFFNAFFARTRYVCIFYLERAEYLQFIVAM